MTLDKAIEVLELSFNDPWIAPKGDFGDAVKLGIEALKRILKQRAPIPCDWGYLLPGETQ